MLSDISRPGTNALWLSDIMQGRMGLSLLARTLEMVL